MREQDQTAIEISGLYRDYTTYEKSAGLMASIKGFWSRKHQTRHALKPTNLTIRRGEIVGLVGANGAGKTTLLKLLSGLIHPTGGDARVLGHQPWQRENDYLRRISILLGQKNQLWWDLPPSDSFELLAKIYGLSSTTAKARVKELAGILDCAHVLNVQLRRLSLGERMKMELIGSLLHQPEVLFLDEPTIGLDVVAQTAVRDFLVQYSRAHQPTIILTSHYMEDISQLAHRLLLISQGDLVFDGTVEQFTNKSQRTQIIRVRLESPLSNLPEEMNWARLEANGWELVAEGSAKEIPQRIEQFTKRFSLVGVKIEEPDFEDTIRKFLAKESSLRPTRHQHQP
jgi:ABC-2 type transport system ATP-binding protein